MLSRFEQLPAELVDAITPDLSLETVRALRLTSRSVQATTFPAFRRRFFSRKSTCLDAYSLSRFAELAARPEFSSAIRRLDIDICLPTPRFNQDLQEVEIYKERLPLKNPPQIENAEFVLALQVLFENVPKKRGLDSAIDALSHILGKLNDLREVRLLSHGRYYRKELSPEVQTASMNLVFKALVKSGVRLEHFSTRDADWDSPASRTAILPWSNATLTTSQITTLTEALRSVKSLDLHVWPPRYSEVPRENTFTQFLTAAANLESLSLNFGEDGSYSKDVVHSLSHMTALPKLSQFRLRACTFNESDLHFFTLHHTASLRKMDLQFVNLQKGTWQSLLTQFRDTLKLESLNLDLLGQGRDSKRVIFSWMDFDSLFHCTMDPTTDEGKRSMKEMLDEVIENHEVHER